MQKFNAAKAAELIAAEDSDLSSNTSGIEDEDKDERESNGTGEQVAEVCFEEPNNDLKKLTQCRRKRKYEATNPKKWKRNQLRTLRETGQPYNDKPARSMGGPCMSNSCRKTNFRECNNITEEQRYKIFDDVWGSMKTFRERKVFVKGLVRKTAPKRQTTAASPSRRCYSFLYQLPVDGSIYPVCKKLFCSTIGIPERTVMHWLSEEESNFKENGEVSSSLPRSCVNRIPEEVNDFIEQFLNSITTVPSHYCRSVYQDQKFLEPGSTLAGLFKEYQEKAEQNGQKSVGYSSFSKKFHSMGFRVFVPKKDQCDSCIKHKVGALSEEEYTSHIYLKSTALKEKSEDKAHALINSDVSVWTMDLQSVLLCPKSKANCMYYKTKLQVHNFTLFCFDTKEGHCFPWSEVDGDLSADVFAYLQYNHFKAYLAKHSHIKTLIIWSDGCGYQNRNATVSNAYMHLAKEQNVTIIQKYLISGHTYMEADSMHSMIERTTRCDMYTPNDYKVAMRLARQNPRPYHVHDLNYAYFKKGFQNLYVTTIRPGKTIGDPKVNDLSALKYNGSLEVYFRVKGASDWQLLPQRVHPGNLFLTQMFESPLKISERKFQDLQSLKSVIPCENHDFYDNLPH